MGIKIQSKTFLPGCYSKMDLNNAGNGMWTMYDTDRNLNNGLFNDAFAASLSVNKYIGCEKERVKQTILKHESEFRNQLQELHRLYRKQKDLMHDLERREFHKHPLPAEKSKSIVLLSEAPECGNNTSNGSNFLMVRSTFGSAASGADTSQPHPSIIKGKSQCSLLSFNGRVHLEDSEYVKPKCDKFMKKMLDLELPADVYADDEGKQQDGPLCGVKGIENFPVERNNKAAFSRDVNLLNDSGLHGASKGDALRPKTYLKIQHNLADLNEPIRMEGTSIAESVNNVVSSTCLGIGTEKWNAYSSSSSDSCFWSTGLSQGCLDGKNGRIIVNNRHYESDRNGNGWLAYDPKAGKSSCNEYTSFGGIIGEHTSTLFRPLQVEPKESPEPLKFMLSDQRNSATKYKTTIFGVELTEGTNNRSGGDTSYTPSLRPLNQQSDVMNSESTRIAPWRKTSNALVQNVVSFQQNHDLRTSASFTGNNLRLIISSKPEVSNQNGLCFGSESVSKQVQGCLDLNTYVANPHGSMTTLVQLQNSASSDMEKHYRGEQIKAKENIYQMNLDSLQNHSQHFFDKAKLTKTPLEDSTSPASGINSGSRKVDEGDPKSSTKGLGKCIDNVPTNHASTRNRDGTPKDLTRNCEIVNKLETKDSIADNGLQNYFSCFRHKVDLNLPLDEEETPSAPSLPVAIVRIATTTEIDLEAPAVLESDKGDVNDEAEHLVEKNDLCSKGSVDDSNDQHVEHARLAAEAIIDISLSKSDAIDPPNQFAETLPADCLLLLADVISSCAHESKLTKGLTTGNEVADEDSVPEGMDYLEFMTLMLQDNKEEGYSYKQCVVEEWNDEENGGSSISKRPRKGQAKRRKDFQRDILPSMVSLSRREVTEDLQSLEEMFKANGHTWESRLLQRRAGNGRGRRRWGGSALPQKQIAVSPPPVQEQQQQQAIHREVELVDRNLTGWGKRTRRLPRQRCSITNNFTSPALKC